MTKFALVLLVFLSLLVPAPAADEKQEAALAECVGAFGLLTMAQTYLSFVQAETNDKALGKDDTTARLISLELNSLDVIKTDSDKLKTLYPDDADMQKYMTQFITCANALHDHGQLIKSGLGAKKDAAALKAAREASKAALVALGGESMEKLP